MAKQVINVGTADFAGDGDGLRTAFTKVNDNFTELYDDDAQDITLASFSATQTAASGGGAPSRRGASASRAARATRRNASAGRGPTTTPPARAARSSARARPRTRGRA